MKDAAALSVRGSCFLAAALSAFALLSGCSGEQADSKPQAKLAPISGPLVVGVVGPMTGEEAHYGTSVAEGISAAAKRFNAQGGVGGQEIQIVSLDDRSDIESTNRIVRELIGRKVVAILAAPTGSSTFAPIHMVNDSGTLFISIGSRRHLKASGPFVFRHAVPDEIATDDLAGYAVKTLGYANFALITAADNDFSLELSSMFRKALTKHGGVIKVQADSYDPLTGNRSLDAVIAAMKKSPDLLHGVIFTGAASEGVQLAQAMRKAGMVQPLLGGEDFFSEEFLNSGDAVNETLLYASFSVDRKSQKRDEFIGDLGKPKPDRFAALAYDTFMLLAEAIKASGSADSAKIREALINRTDFEGVTGKTRFSPENLPIKHPLLYRIEKAEDGERRYVLKTGTEHASLSGAAQQDAK